MSSNQLVAHTATTSLDTATTTLPVATSAPPDAAGTTSTPTIEIPQAFGGSPFTDTFDSPSELSAWTGMVDGAFQFDTSTADCYAGECILNNTFNTMDRMYRIGTPLRSGTAVLYFKNAGYLAQITFGICNDAGCQSGDWAGVFATPSPIFSSAWRYWFLAWREGTTSEETCSLTDDASLADCSWSESGLPKGTYDGIVIAQNAGMRLGSAIYFDQLGSGTSSAGVQ